MRFINKHEESETDKECLHDGHRDRLRETLLHTRFDDVDDYIALEYILFGIVPRKDTNEIAHRLINTFGCLANVCEADVVDLKKVKGVSENMAIFLNLFPYMFRNYKLSKQKPKATLTCTQDVFNYLGNAICHLPQEEFYVICLDNGDHVINQKLVSRGNNTEVNIRINEIVRFATSVNARKVVFVHNHPTTSEDPSQEDIETTKKLYMAFKYHNIKIVEHLIVNYMGRSFSFSNNGILQSFEEYSRKI
ncbi:MAG: RadC family protein [Christensenellales bacterium]